MDKRFLKIMMFILAACLVEAIPSIPETYSGYASINGIMAPAGTSIQVKVNGTDELVGSTTAINSEGLYALDVIFDDSETSGEDEGADSGDKLVWYVNGTQADIPEPATDTATSGKVNGLFNVSVGDPPVRIVAYSPPDLNPVVNENSSITFTVSAVGPPDSTLTYNWTVEGETQSTTDSLIYNTSVGENGTKNVTVVVTNGSSSDTQSWNLKVNLHPVITPIIPNQNLSINELFDFDLTAYETDYEDSGTDLTWGVEGVDSFYLSTFIDTDTDVLTFIPRKNRFGVGNITLILYDSDGGTDTQNITVKVIPICNGINPPITGDWNITFYTTCTDTQINLSQNSSLTIVEEKTLKFDNTTLNLNSSQGNPSFILVEGVLEVFDSVIQFFS